MQQVPLTIPTGISTQMIAVAMPDQMTCEDGMCSFCTIGPPSWPAFIVITASSYSFVMLLHMGIHIKSNRNIKPQFPKKFPKERE
jgi:hypothetical protein